MFKLVSCINHATSSGASSLDFQFCARMVYSTSASPPSQLINSCIENTWLVKMSALLCQKSLHLWAQNQARNRSCTKLWHRNVRIKCELPEDKEGWKEPPGIEIREDGLQKMVLEKGDQLTVKWTDGKEEKATGEGASLSLVQTGSEVQHNPGFQRAFCFCCGGSAPATMLIGWILSGAVICTSMPICCRWKRNNSHWIAFRFCSFQESKFNKL